MKITAEDLKKLGIIDRVILEHPVVSADNINRITLYMKRKIAEFMIHYGSLTEEEIVNKRYERFRVM